MADLEAVMELPHVSQSECTDSPRPIESPHTTSRTHGDSQNRNRKHCMAPRTVDRWTDGAIQSRSTAIVRVTVVIIVSQLMSSRLAANGPEQAAAHRSRARELGIRIGILPTGPLNAITDVGTVRVGHATLIAGEGVRTGVTVVLPHEGNVFQQKVPAGVAVGNGFGKFVGVTQIDELGVLETPIALTNTLSTFTVADALVKFTLGQAGNEDVRSVNPAVGECNDGFLNDIRLQRIKAEDVLRAIDAARPGAVAEGSVGAGTGTRCMGWKGGIGTSSRFVPESAGGYRVGVLAQTNFNGILTINGAPVGRELGRYYLKQETTATDPDDDRGSCILVVATDAPLDSRQLRRLARRALLAIAAVGSPMTHGSGDYAIAFSTHADVRIPYESSDITESRPTLREDLLSPLFLAAREAGEEAIVNSLLKATSLTGYQGHHSEAIPIERVVEICRRHAVIDE